jgi:hypothetical protein
MHSRVYSQLALPFQLKLERAMSPRREPQGDTDCQGTATKAPAGNKNTSQDKRLHSLAQVHTKKHKTRTHTTTTTRRHDKCQALVVRPAGMPRTIASRYIVATIRDRALTVSFRSLISLSMSSMNWITKSISLCLYMLSRWVLVIKKEML